MEGERIIACLGLRIILNPTVDPVIVVFDCIDQPFIIKLSVGLRKDNLSISQFEQVVLAGIEEITSCEIHFWPNLSL